MNVIEYLQRQHEEVREILDRIIAEDDKKESRSLCDQLSKVLRLHMKIEEKMVYPAASRAFDGDDDEEETVLESYEEHAVASRCLDALEITSPSDKRFVIRAKVLKGILDKHIDEEESGLFPELENKLGPSGIARLSEQIERKMSEMERESAPRRSRSSEPKSTTRRSSPRSQVASGTLQRGRAGQTTRRGARTRAAKPSGSRGSSRAQSSRKRG